MVLLEQIRTLDKRRLKEKMGHLDEEAMGSVNSAIAISFGLPTGGEEKPSAAASVKENTNFMGLGLDFARDLYFNNG